MGVEERAWGVFIAMTTLLGGGSAAGSLAIARVTDDRQSLEQGEQTTDARLSQEERRKLQGAPDSTISST